MKIEFIIKLRNVPRIVTHFSKYKILLVYLILHLVYIYTYQGTIRFLQNSQLAILPVVNTHINAETVIVFNIILQFNFS